MEFSERTIRIIIDVARCDDCPTHACVEACRTYDRGILELIANHPGVALAADDLMRRGTECLACEEACRRRGLGALRIEAAMPGLERLRAAYGTNR